MDRSSANGGGGISPEVVGSKKSSAGVLWWLGRVACKTKSKASKGEKAESKQEASIFKMTLLPSKNSMAPPVFERKRRRHKTVVWKYKKSIGFFASLVFICNQILASGLTGMPSIVSEAGWISTFVVNVFFCVLSSLCSMLLLKTMTLIEGNHHFEERYEYSAILRHYLTNVTGLNAVKDALSHDNSLYTKIDGVIYKVAALFVKGSAVSDGGEGLRRLATSRHDVKGESKMVGGRGWIWRRVTVPIINGIGYFRSVFKSWWVHFDLPDLPRWSVASLPQTMAVILHINTFLGACSAALLVAYCLDSLLLRLFSCTIFIPIIPVRYNSVLGNLGELILNIFELVKLVIWPILWMFRYIAWFIDQTAPAWGIWNYIGGCSLYTPSVRLFRIISTTTQLEEVFSGVCESGCTDVPGEVFGDISCSTCVSYIGVSLGYIITAAIGMHLAASDLEDTMSLQYMSFGGILLAVLHVSITALYNLTQTSGESAIAHGPLIDPNPLHDSSAVTDPLGANDIGEGFEFWSTVARICPWLMIFKSYWATTMIPNFVDAYGYTSSLPSWANEVKDEVSITGTVWISSLFSGFIYVLFGTLCATAFPSIAESSNVLAAMMHEPELGSTLVAVILICMFHIVCLLPNVVFNQISARYDLLNMAICLDKRSAFFTATTLHWLTYWVLAYTPVFSKVASVLVLLTGLLLNFVIPAVVFCFASLLNCVVDLSEQEVGRRQTSLMLSNDNSKEYTSTVVSGSRESVTEESASKGGGRGRGVAGASGALCASGGAKTREMQRQLEQWLEEFSKRDPDSEVAQLLQRNEDDSDIRTPKQIEEEERRNRFSVYVRGSKLPPEGAQKVDEAATKQAAPLFTRRTNRSHAAKEVVPFVRLAVPGAAGEKEDSEPSTNTVFGSAVSSTAELKPTFARTRKRIGTYIQHQKTEATQKSLEAEATRNESDLVNSEKAAGVDANISTSEDLQKSDTNVHGDSPNVHDTENSAKEKIVDDGRTRGISPYQEEDKVSVGKGLREAEIVSSQIREQSSNEDAGRHSKPLPQEVLPSISITEGSSEGQCDSTQLLVSSTANHPHLAHISINYPAEKRSISRQAQSSKYASIGELQGAAASAMAEETEPINDPTVDEASLNVSKRGDTGVLMSKLPKLTSLAELQAAAGAAMEQEAEQIRLEQSDAVSEANSNVSKRVVVEANLHISKRGGMDSSKSRPPKLAGLAELQAAAAAAMEQEAEQIRAEQSGGVTEANSNVSKRAGMDVAMSKAPKLAGLAELQAAAAAAMEQEAEQIRAEQSGGVTEANSNVSKRGGMDSSKSRPPKLAGLAELQAAAAVAMEKETKQIMAEQSDAVAETNSNVSKLVGMDVAKSKAPKLAGLAELQAAAASAMEQEGEQIMEESDAGAEANSNVNKRGGMDVSASKAPKLGGLAELQAATAASMEQEAEKIMAEESDAGAEANSNVNKRGGMDVSESEVSKLAGLAELQGKGAASVEEEAEQILAKRGDGVAEANSNVSKCGGMNVSKSRSPKLAGLLELQEPAAAAMDEAAERIMAEQGEAVAGADHCVRTNGSCSDMNRNLVTSYSQTSTCFANDLNDLEEISTMSSGITISVMQPQGGSRNYKFCRMNSRRNDDHLGDVKVGSAYDDLEKLRNDVIAFGKANANIQDECESRGVTLVYGNISKIKSSPVMESSSCENLHVQSSPISFAEHQSDGRHCSTACSMESVEAFSTSSSGGVKYPLSAMKCRDRSSSRTLRKTSRGVSWGNTLEQIEIPASIGESPSNEQHFLNLSEDNAEVMDMKVPVTITSVDAHKSGSESPVDSNVAQAPVKRMDTRQRRSKPIIPGQGIDIMAALRGRKTDTADCGQPLSSVPFSMDREKQNELLSPPQFVRTRRRVATTAMKNSEVADLVSALPNCKLEENDDHKMEPSSTAAVIGEPVVEINSSSDGPSKDITGDLGEQGINLFTSKEDTTQATRGWFFSMKWNSSTNTRITAFPFITRSSKERYASFLLLMLILLCVFFSLVGEVVDGILFMLALILSATHFPIMLVSILQPKREMRTPP